MKNSTTTTEQREDKLMLQALKIIPMCVAMYVHYCMLLREYVAT